MERRDLDAVAAWHAGVRTQQIPHGRIEPGVAPLDHVGQHEGGEHLGYRADLEDGVGIRRTGVIGGQPPVAHHAPAVSVHDADDEADGAAFAIDQPGQNLPDHVVGGDGRRLGHGDVRRQQHGDGGDEHAIHDRLPATEADRSWQEPRCIRRPPSARKRCPSNTPPHPVYSPGGEIIMTLLR